MAKFIDLGNAMINIESIEGIWKRDNSRDEKLTHSYPYLISLTFRNTNRTEDIKFKTKVARDGIYNYILNKLKGGLL